MDKYIVLGHPDNGVNGNIYSCNDLVGLISNNPDLLFQLFRVDEVLAAVLLDLGDDGGGEGALLPVAPVHDRLGRVRLRIDFIQVQFRPVHDRLGRVRLRIDFIQVQLRPVHDRLGRVRLRTDFIQVQMRPVHDRLGRVRLRIYFIQVQWRPVHDLYHFYLDPDPRIWIGEKWIRLWGNGFCKSYFSLFGFSLFIRRL